METKKEAGTNRNGANKSKRERIGTEVSKPNVPRSKGGLEKENSPS